MLNTNVFFLHTTETLFFFFFFFELTNLSAKYFTAFKLGKLVKNDILVHSIRFVKKEIHLSQNIHCH